MRFGEDAAPPITIRRRLLKLYFRALRAIHEGCGHDGNETAGMNAFLFNETKDFRGSKRWNHHMLAAKQGEEMRDTPAIRVEKRNGVQFDSAAFDVESQTNVPRVEITYFCE